VSREGAEVTSAGRVFQTRAPATEKARRPTVGSLTVGTHRFHSVQPICSVPSNLWSRYDLHVVGQHGVLYAVGKQQNFTPGLSEDGRIHRNQQAHFREKWHLSLKADKTFTIYTPVRVNGICFPCYIAWYGVSLFSCIGTLEIGLLHNLRLIRKW